MTRAYRMIKELYQYFPAVHRCKKGCHECCGPLMMADSEMEALGLPVEPWDPRDLMNPYAKVSVQFYKETLTCRLVTPEGCKNYENRPLICRMFGHVRHTKLMHCPKGYEYEIVSADQGEAIKAIYHQLIFLDRQERKGNL